MPEEVPIGRGAAAGLALAFMWAPFLVCVMLSGDKQAWKYILMLPGAVLAVLMHVRARDITCYMTSALLTLTVVGITVALEKRSRAACKLTLVLTLLASSVMAFLSLLMLRA